MADVSFPDLSAAIFKSRREGQVLGCPADEFALVVSGVQELEAILKSLAISDLRFETHRISDARQLELQFHGLSAGNAARNGCTQAAFAQVFGAPMKCFRRPNDHPDV